MSNVIRIKRRAGNGATGAPSSLKNAELAYNEADDTLYYGKGSDGSGDATTIPAIGGSGAYVTKTTEQTISGAKTFSGTTTFSGSVSLGSSATATTKSSGNNSTAVATTAYVDAAVGAVSGSFTLAGDSGSSQTVTLGDTLTIAGGTGIDSVAGATDTITINIDSTVATLSGSQTLTNKTINSPVVSGLYLSDSNIVFEGSTADAYETTLTVTDPTADRTITLPDASGTVALNGSIALGTDTTGDYVTSLVAGTGISLSNNSGEGATPTIAIGQAVSTSSDVTFATVTTSGNGSVGGNLTITGNLTVNGTTTTVNSTTITVDDKNLELGSTASPSDASADGGGITLKGTSDKTFNWLDATDSWTSSEHIDLATGKAYYINGTSVLSGTTLGSGVTGSSLTSVGTIATGVWQGTAVGVSYGGTGATSAADARTNLGLVIGTNVQAYNSTLAAVASGTYSGASSITTLGTIGTGTWQGTAVGVSYGGTGATSASSARTNLGLAIGSDVQAYSATLAAVAGGSYTGATSITTVGTISTGTWSATIDNTTVDGGTF